MKITNKSKSLVIVICMILMCLFGCSQKPQQIDHSELLYKMHDSIVSLKVRVVSSGDTTAYNALKNIYNSYYDNPKEHIIYSLIMANDYHYPTAYFDVYQNLLGIYDGDFNKMDKESKALAVLHLKRGAELNYTPCKTELKILNLK